jgi:hypothetical protein
MREKTADDTPRRTPIESERTGLSVSRGSGDAREYNQRMAQEERRRARRYPVVMRIDFDTGGGVTQDVSGLGVLFHTDVELDKGEQVDFSLVLPLSAIRCRGRVVRVTSEGDMWAVAATIDRCLLPEETSEDPSGTRHRLIGDLRTYHPEGWEWGE